MFYMSAYTSRRPNPKQAAAPCGPDDGWQRIGAVQTIESMESTGARASASSGRRTHRHAKLTDATTTRSGTVHRRGRRAAWRRLALLAALSELVAAIAFGAPGPAVTPVLFFGAEHLIVDSANPHGKHYLEQLSGGRPTPLPPSIVVEQGAQLGASRAATAIGAPPCGVRTDAALVLCLDERGLLAPSDQLEAMAFAALPTDVRVGTDAARNYIASILTKAPGKATSADIRISTDACGDVCARQIRLERRS
jgi:hypothetical protein